MTNYARLLGVPQFYLGETQHALPLTKASALLLYLAYQGAWVGRDELLYLFYPDSPEQPARVNLRQLLTVVRKLPYSEGLETEETRLRWKVETDVAKFRQAISEEKWSKALELYKGELLQGFNPHDLSEFNNWLSLERQTLHTSWRKASLTFAGELATTERYSLATEVLANVHKADPLDEEVLRMYLEGLYNSQQKSNALETFATFKKMLHQEVGSEPESKTLELISLMQQDKPLSTRGSVAVKTQTKEKVKHRHNLPVQPTPFVGRDIEKTRLAALFADSDCRLVTIVAPGGMGKTRLAIEVARSQLEQFEETYFVSFAAVASPDLMVYTLADALELSLFGSKPPKEQVLDYLKNKHMLLVLDNLEHLLTGIDLISETLAASSETKILATSRERLSLQSEHLFDLYGLAVEGSHASDALQLFAERAKHNRLDFVLEQHLQAVTRICQLVGGMPLAIELAASWLRLLSPSEIVTELEQNLDILSTSARDLPERHHNMQSVFEVSWQRLSHEEQTALRKLSVFQGGFEKEAARAVAEVDLSTLLSFLNKSFVWRNTTGRFSQHPLILQYIQNKARDFPEDKKQVEEKHGLYYLDLFNKKAPEVGTQQGGEILEALEKEFPNFHMAWNWMLREKRFDKIGRVTSALNDFFIMSSYMPEGADMFKRAALALDENNPQHQAALGHTLVQQAYIKVMTNFGGFTSQIETFQRGLALLEPLKEFSGIIWGQIVLGAAAWEQGELTKAKEILTSALNLARTYGTPRDIGRALAHLVLVVKDIDTFAEVSASIEPILKELHELGNTLNLSYGLVILGGYLVYNDCLDEGEKLLLESLEHSRKHNDFVVYTLAALAKLAYKRCNYEQAETLVQQAYESALKLSNDYMKATTLASWGRVKLAQGHLSEAERLIIEGLKVGWHIDSHHAASHALVFLAELSIAQGQVKQGITLLSFLSHYQAIEKRDRDEAIKLLEETKNQLSARAFTQAQKESKSLTLEQIVTGILEQGIG